MMGERWLTLIHPLDSLCEVVGSVAMSIFVVAYIVRGVRTGAGISPWTAPAIHRNRAILHDPEKSIVGIPSKGDTL